MPAFNTNGNPQQQGAMSGMPTDWLSYMQQQQANRGKMFQWLAIGLALLDISNQSNVETQRSGTIATALTAAKADLKDLDLTSSAEAAALRDKCVAAFDDVITGFTVGSTASGGILGGVTGSSNNLLLIGLFLLMTFGGPGGF